MNGCEDPPLHERRAGFAGMWDAENGKGGAEFAGGEGAECAEAGGEFEGGDAALAVEPAEEVGGELFAFLRIALDTG